MKTINQENITDCTRTPTRVFLFHQNRLGRKAIRFLDASVFVIKH
jgi:hypothetical protein